MTPRHPHRTPLATPLAGAALTLVVIAAAACDRGQSEPPPPTTVTTPTTPAATTEPAPATGAARATPAGAVKIEFKDGDGREVLAFKPKDNGAKVVDGTGAEIVRITAKGDTGDKVKLKGPDDTVLAYIQARDDGSLEIEDPTSKQRLFVFKRQDDGDYKLEDGAGTRLYDVKVRPYGFEIFDSKGDRELYKVKVKGEKTSLRRPDDSTAYATKDPVAAVAVACLGFDALPQPLRLGLYHQVQKHLGRTP
ncbi:hypothetical protein [Haliangium sp.]|uniref:hypothetical protein n=1 Tax=Haliangium sp. TaxID=2663208 RepID=UPI003D098E16